MLCDESEQEAGPSLVTLLSSEAQYVALWNVNLNLILKNEMKVSFVKYNDPIYIKLDKVDIMICLTSQSNIAQVLGFFEVDVEFVRKSVRAVGQCYCNMKVEQSAECCVSTLLIQTKVNNVVQEVHDENIQVQLQLLISIMEQFLKSPTDTQELVQQVFLLMISHFKYGLANI